MALQFKASTPRGSKAAGTLPPTPSFAKRSSAPPTPSRSVVRTTTPGVGNIDGNQCAKIGRDKSHSAFGLKSLSEIKQTGTESPKKKSAMSRESSKADTIDGGTMTPSQTFVVANAVQTILAVAKNVSTAATEQLQKDDYGRVPKYLGHMKANVDSEYDYICQMDKDIPDLSRKAGA